MAVERMEVEVIETFPIAHCNHGTSCCRSQETGRSTDKSNGQTGLVSGTSTYKYAQIYRNPFK